MNAMRPEAVRLRYLGELDELEDQQAIRLADDRCFEGLAPKIEFSHGACWWVIGDPDQPMAYAAIRPSRAYSDCAYLSRAGVLPEFRGFGLQRILIKARLRWAARRGFRWAITDTVATNTGSANNLIRCGFKLWNPPDDWLTPGAIWLARRLPTGRSQQL